MEFKIQFTLTTFTTPPTSSIVHRQVPIHILLHKNTLTNLIYAPVITRFPTQFNSRALRYSRPPPGVGSLTSNEGPLPRWNKAASSAPTTFPPYIREVAKTKSRSTPHNPSKSPFPPHVREVAKTGASPVHHNPSNTPFPPHVREVAKTGVNPALHNPKKTTQ